MTDQMDDLILDDMDDSLIILVDEEGQEHSFQMIEVLELDGNQYAVLVPWDTTEDADDAIVLKIRQDENGDDVLYDIEDDEEWERVVALWNEEIE